MIVLRYHGDPKELLSLLSTTIRDVARLLKQELSIQTPSVGTLFRAGEAIAAWRTDKGFAGWCFCVGG
jgi:hypothetical protein